MIKSFLFIPLLLLLQSFALGQDYDAMTSDVRQKFTQIRENIDPEHSITLHETEGENQITGYLIDGKLSLIETISFDETGKNIIEYYFDYEDLIFTLVQHIDYIENASKDLSDLPSLPLDFSTESESRFYFHDQKLFLWLDINNEAVDLTDSSNVLFGLRIQTEGERIKIKLTR